MHSKAPRQEKRASHSVMRLADLAERVETLEQRVTELYRMLLEIRQQVKREKTDGRA